MSEKEPALELREVSTFYGEICALKAVSLTAYQGEIVAVIGGNGAGKTTMLRTICGMLTPRSGDVVFYGRRITGTPPEKLVKLGLSHVPERRHVFAPMQVIDNLLLGAYTRKDSRAKIEGDFENVYGLFPRLRERRRQLAGTLSGGEQQMLALGRGLMPRPKLLLLDEPSLGLAPLLTREIMEAISKLRDGGMTVLLVEQNARAALRIADRGYVMETGRIVLEGAAADLSSNERVQAAYLGKGYRQLKLKARHRRHEEGVGSLGDDE